MKLRPFRARRFHFGFTLVEILTALALVMVLSLLAYWGLGTVTQRSQNIQCASHLRSLYMAVAFYANDNDQCLPYTSELRHGFNGTNWHRRIWSYIDKQGTYENWTEAFHQARDGSGSWVYFCPASTVRLISYAFNGNLIDKRKNHFSSAVLLLVDSKGSTPTAEPPKLITGSPANLNAGRIAYRHMENCNVVFLDGRVEHRGPDYLPDYARDPGLWGR